MPPRDPAAYLDDIRDAIKAVSDAVTDLMLEGYCALRQIRSAVEREFMIIGEGLRQLLDVEPGLANRITAARDIISFRNHLAHGYFTISNATVWGIIEGHLPQLRDEIKALRAERGLEP